MKSLLSAAAVVLCLSAGSVNATIYEGVGVEDAKSILKTAGFAAAIDGRVLTVAGATTFTLEFPGCAADPCGDFRLKAVMDKSGGGDAALRSFNELSTSFSTALSYETSGGKAALVADVVAKGATRENLAYSVSMFATLLNELANEIGSTKLIDIPPEPSLSPKAEDAAKVRVSLSSNDIARILNARGYTAEVVTSGDGSRFVRATKAEFQWAATAGLATSDTDESDVIIFRTPPVAGTAETPARISAWNNSERWINANDIGGSANGFMPFVLTGGVTEDGIGYAADAFDAQARKFTATMKAAPAAPAPTP